MNGFYAGSPPAIVPFDLAGVALAAGDSVLFVVGDGGGTYYADSTGLQVTASFGAPGSPAADDPFGYLGGLGYWQDPALADSGLSYVRQRWLENATGQWLSVDPVASEPRYGYVHNMPTAGVDPDGTDGIFGFNSVQEAIDTLYYLPSAAGDEGDAVRDQIQQYLIMNIGRLIGFGADADAAGHRWLKTYSNIKSQIPGPMQRLMPPSTSLTEVGVWFEAFSTNYLIGFGTEALETGKQLVVSSIPGVNAYQGIVSGFEHARQVIALVTEIIKDATFFNNIGVSFEVFLVRHVGGPLLDALVELMSTKPIPPEILGSIAGAIAFQACLIIVSELATLGAATPVVAAEEAVEGAAIMGRLNRLAEGTGKIARGAQRAQRFVADYQDVTRYADSLKSRVDVVNRAKGWFTKLAGDSKAESQISRDVNRRHALLNSKIKRVAASEGPKKIRKFISVNEVLSALRGTTQVAERIASGIESGKIRLNFLSNGDFEALFYQIRKQSADRVVAFHARGEIVVRRGALDIDAAVVHEGVHALDYKQFIGQRGAKSITHGRAERRAYLAEQEYRIATENVYQDKLEFDSISDISKHIKKEYPVRLPAFARD